MTEKTKHPIKWHFDPKPLNSKTPNVDDVVITLSNGSKIHFGLDDFKKVVVPARDGGYTVENVEGVHQLFKQYAPEIADVMDVTGVKKDTLMMMLSSRSCDIAKSTLDALYDQRYQIADFVRETHIPLEKFSGFFRKMRAGFGGALNSVLNHQEDFKQALEKGVPQQFFVNIFTFSNIDGYLKAIELAQKADMVIDSYNAIKAKVPSESNMPSLEEMVTLYTTKGCLNTCIDSVNKRADAIAALIDNSKKEFCSLIARPRNGQHDVNYFAHNIDVAYSNLTKKSLEKLGFTNADIHTIEKSPLHEKPDTVIQSASSRLEELLSYDYLSVEKIKQRRERRGRF